MDLSVFEKIYMHPESQHSRVGQRILNLFGSEKIHVTAQPPELRSGTMSRQQFDQSKKEIFVTPFQGSFFKRCPGAKPGLACCNYFVLNLGLQCNMNCSYCYLQSFLNSPYLTIYSNIDVALSELGEMMKSYPEHAYRVGTGETIDSLSLDPITLYSRDLIEFFRPYPNWRLEFKTKSDLVDQFLDVPHSGNVIVSWSINPQVIVEAEEHGTASLEQRLQAAEKCRAKGFPISFHMDPMIWHPDWEQSYGELIDEVASRFDPSDTLYVSVGGLRFQPEQKALMRERFSFESWALRAEMHASPDGKLRYDRSLRQGMFQFAMERFKKHNPAWKVFLCMETPETWLQVAGDVPARRDDIKPLFKHLPQN